MTDRTITLPAAPNDEEARKAAAMHRVYSYLLQLAARKEAADRRKVSEADNLSAEEGALPQEQDPKGVYHNG